MIQCFRTGSPFSIRIQAQSIFRTLYYRMPVNKTRKIKHKKVSRIPEFGGTLTGIEYWQHKMFQKFGFMLLAKERGDASMIAEYKKNLLRLRKTIEQVSAEYEQKNTKHDLKLMKLKLDVLIDFTNKHL